MKRGAAERVCLALARDAHGLSPAAQRSVREIMATTNGEPPPEWDEPATIEWLGACMEAPRRALARAGRMGGWRKAVAAGGLQ